MTTDHLMSLEKVQPNIGTICYLQLFIKNISQTLWYCHYYNLVMTCWKYGIKMIAENWPKCWLLHGLYQYDQHDTLYPSMCSVCLLGEQSEPDLIKYIIKITSGIW